MIVRIARVKVGNRQAPLAKTLAQPGGGFAFYPHPHPSHPSADTTSIPPRQDLTERRLHHSSAS